MNKTYAFTFICLAFVLVGCASEPLYVTNSSVSIYLEGDPVVKENTFEIRFHFESPTKEKHIIQQIECGGWTGIESFRLHPNGSTSTDTHFIENRVYDKRRMTLIPGEVADVDEGFFSGFSMLPSGWPDNWNAKFRQKHKIQGTIVKMRPEFQTIYHLEFAQGKLIWTVEGTSVRREWSMTKQ
jgi:hypothetical protein